MSYSGKIRYALFWIFFFLKINYFLFLFQANYGGIKINIEDDNKVSHFYLKAMLFWIVLKFLLIAGRSWNELENEQVSARNRSREFFGLYFLSF